MRVRREHALGKAIKAIARDLYLSRKVVRKAICHLSADISYRHRFSRCLSLSPFSSGSTRFWKRMGLDRGVRKLRLTYIPGLLSREGFDARKMRCVAMQPASADCGAGR